jgi:transketolase C-terminal domain/subunit
LPRRRDKLRSEGLDVGVVNARFIKPLDTQTIVIIEHAPFVITSKKAA